MSTADHILDQIDTALGDYSISGDAMRVAPDLPPPPEKPHPFSGRSALVQRLVDRRGLTPDQAREAVGAAERGQDGPYTDLVGQEAQVIADEVCNQLRAAFRPVIERVAEQVKQVAEAFQQLRESAACEHQAPVPRRDRPVWQSPYGPPTRRR